MEPTARRMRRLVEPIHLVTYLSDEPTDALMALGHRNHWDGRIAALVAAGIGGTEAHLLHALSEGIPAEKFGRVHHLPSELDQLIADLEPISAALDAAGSR